MLTGLEAVNWENLHHAYGVATNIPERLRALDEAASDDIFEKRHYELVNDINHQGSIYSVTPVVVPFLLQLLERSSIPKRKAYLLYTLAHLLECTQVHTIRTDGQPIVYYRLHLNLYDAVTRGIDQYIALLSDKDYDVQAISLYLLSHFLEEHKRLIPIMMNFVQQTDHPWIQAGAIWGYTRLISQEDEFNRFKPEPYLNQLLQWATEDGHPLKREAAAFSYISISSAPPASLTDLPNKQFVIPDLIVELAAKGFVPKVDDFTQLSIERERMLYSLSDFTPFDDMRVIITQNC